MTTENAVQDRTERVTVWHDNRNLNQTAYQAKRSCLHRGIFPMVLSTIAKRNLTANKLDQLGFQAKETPLLHCIQKCNLGAH